MENIPTIIASLFIGSWGYGVIEAIGVSFFISPFYHIGIPVFQESINLDSANISWPNTQIIKKSNGKFHFSADQNLILFFTRFKPFRIYTLFPFKGVGFKNANHQIQIKGYLPIGTTLFFGFFELVFLLATLIGILAGRLEFVLVGILIMLISGLGLKLSFALEKRRMYLKMEELKKILD